MILIVCGVSGAGKTTIGMLLSEALGIPFFDADDYQPASNIKKMKSGLPLDDDDRKPWLETLAGNLSTWQKQGSAVLACSALKESYREELGSQYAECTRWIVLSASEVVLTDRLKSRKGHFFDPQLLSSQLDALEIPDYGWVIDAESTPQEIVNMILKRLRSE